MVATTKKTKAKPSKAQPKKTTTNSKPTAKPQVGNKQNAGEKRKRTKGQGLEYIPIPESVIKDDDDDMISDEDLEFFAANKDFGKFLSGLDTKELSKNEKKIPQPKMERPKPKPEDYAISSSDEEDYYDSQDEIKSDVDDDEVNSDVGDLLDSDDDNENDVADDVDGKVDEEEESDIENEAEMEDDEEEEEPLVSSDEEKEEEEEQPVKKRKLKQNDSDEEMVYEKIPRKVAKEWTQKEKSTKLPIKLPDGKIAHVESEEPQLSSAEESASEDEKEEEEQVEAQSSDEEEEEQQEEEKKLSKRQYILQKKEELAKIATTILEDPNENVGKLKAMRKIADDENLTVKKLALLSQLAVYRDIIPGYRIRQLTEKEEAVKVSKEVKKLREFEQGLLRNYELYLKDLDSALTKKKKASEEEKSLALVAAKCLCELLTTKTYFNFRLNIMVSVVACMSTIEWNELAEMCRKAIVTVFEEDELGRVSLDGVIMITRMIKSKGYNVHENVINTFLHLRLKDELTPEASKSKNDNKDKVKKRKKDQPFLNKKARKALKETKEIEKELKEAEAVVDKEEKEKHHTETLKLIFAFYFRILKKQATSPLLPAVLLGLGKFAHLINVGFFEDVLNALKDVMDNLDHKSHGITASSGTRKRLLCIVTAFELLAGQSDLIEYDLKSYYGELYGILFDAAFHYMLEDRPSPEMSSESEMILRGLELMFLKKRGVPIDRMAAFIKRFSLVALNMPHKTVITCLELMKRLINKDHRLDALTQSEDRAASGVYMPYLTDPDLCNPFGTSLYELFLYKDHYDPNVRALAQTIQQPPAV